MNNYKIRVNNEAESREAQELFFGLGYRSGIASNNHFPVLVVAHDYGYGPESTTAISMDHEHHKYYAELTLPQLRDLVAQSKSNEQGLISGADALIAIGKGERVQYSFDDDKYWQNDIANLKITDFGGGHYAFRLKPRTVKIEIEVPAPFEPKYGDECFILNSDSEDGFHRFVYEENSGFHKNLIQFGVWRTKPEIIIVVEQLRKIKEHSK